MTAKILGNGFNDRIFMARERIKNCAYLRLAPFIGPGDATKQQKAYVRNQFILK